MDEKKNKNNLEVTETAEEKVEKAGEQTEQEENFFKKTWNRVRKHFRQGIPPHIQREPQNYFGV